MRAVEWQKAHVSCVWAQRWLKHENQQLPGTSQCYHTFPFRCTITSLSKFFFLFFTAHGSFSEHWENRPIHQMKGNKNAPTNQRKKPNTQAGSYLGRDNITSNTPLRLLVVARCVLYLCKEKKNSAFIRKPVLLCKFIKEVKPDLAFVSFFFCESMKKAHIC